MRSTTSSQAKRSAKSRSSSTTGGRRSSPTTDASSSTGLTSMMDSVMASVSAGQELKGTIDNFARAIDELTHGDAANSVAQVQQTIESATVTVMHAKETFDLAKTAFDSVKGTAKDVFQQVKEKPEPFIAAAVPAVIGLYMVLRRAQGARSGQSVPRRTPTRSLNA